MFTIHNPRNIQDKHGNYDVYPKIIFRDIEIPTTSPTSRLTLHNSSPRGRSVEFTNVVAGERIEMHHRIVNARYNQHIFHSWNNQPFFLVENLNILTVNTNCSIDVHVQFPIF